MPLKRKAPSKKTAEGTDAESFSPPPRGQRDDSESFSPPAPRKAQLSLPLAKTLTLDAAQHGIELLASAERDHVPLASLLTALQMLIPIVETAERTRRLTRCVRVGCASSQPTVKCACGDAAYCASCAENFKCACPHCGKYWCDKCVASCDFCRKKAKDKQSRAKNKNRFTRDCLGEKQCGKAICVPCDEDMGLEEEECNCSECFEIDF